MDNLLKLVQIYLLVCDYWEKSIKYSAQRFSNNNIPSFTDQEIVTIMLYCTAFERRRTQKEIYEFTIYYLSNWFPNMPSYVAFNKRVNRLIDAYKHLLNLIIEDNRDKYAQAVVQNPLLVDSMPIITCSGKRKGKVATEFTDKGYCSTKQMYYFGVKIHSLAFQIKRTLPFPESIIITTASESDLNVFRDYWSDFKNTTNYGDKAYKDKAMANKMIENDSIVLHPVKYDKGTPVNLKMIAKAADDIYSKMVSAVRQPIESLFSCIIERTDIQRASKVRSSNGLIIHIFNRLVAFFLLKLVFNC